MPQLEARRSERIDYRGEVELLTRPGTIQLPQSVLARALDLGPGGMRIATPSLMPIGAEVMCRITLGGHPTSLPGRVVWRREPNAHETSIAHGIGICFDPLSAYESGLLQQVVERSSVGLGRADGDAFGDGDNVRFRRRARYGYPAEIEAEERQEVAGARDVPVAAPASRAFASTSAQRASAQKTPWLPMFIAALVGGMLAWSAAARLSGPQPVSQAEFVARPRAVSAVKPAPPEPPAPPAPPTVVDPDDAQVISHTPRLLESVVDETGTAIRVPFEGSLEGLRSTIWAEPAAIAIDLPGGRSTLEPGRYPIDVGGVADLRVNRSARSLLLRIHLLEPIARYTITAENGVLEARLQRGRGSLTAN